MTTNKIADRIKYPIHFGNFNEYPNNAKFKKFGVIEVDLVNQEIDDIFKKFRKNYRYEIKKCKR